MNNILHEKLNIFVIIYLDDILVFSKDPMLMKNIYIGFLISFKNII